ncbi:hypothetical protein OIE66_09015 [Nonomuraea sp. NBC_01738]|uniref:hypothetical protein n=1 Tax=Nonomuraea sp. NBC_01738 TaxID=2976003 RepID=UPI002E12E8C2|nr:hypothetical protein OIE66_09015 [Nonomuraea sp. NBC_01738]
MGRRLSSRAVSVGAVTAISVLVLGACGQQSSYPSPVETVAGGDESDSFHEDDEEEEGVVATCVRRDSEDDETYEVVSDTRCSGVGKHGAYLWYYGGHRAKGRISDGSTRRPPSAYIITRSGDEISRSGKVTRDGFGHRTTVGS